jgi:predicted methyltransferase
VKAAAYVSLAFAALIATASVVASPREHSAAETRKAITAALADPARADQAVDDDRRKAAEVLAFAGVGPGDQVIDLLPGQGYWTRIFTGIVGAKGHVYAEWPASAAKYAVKPLPALQALKLPNVTAELLSDDAPTAAKPVDLVWTVQNYHDLAEDGIAAVNAAIFKVLKPGGRYVVIDHADAAGSGRSGTSTKHRIEPAVVKAEVLKAGFEFVGESTALQNPADDHSLKVFDPQIKGHTDQFAYKFRKPG